jgi:ERCC4-related helicase
VIRQFRNGGYNTLVATCVGEEGLDIGEVDLIVCFDASASPIRLVQRMGRTGRKRDGRIVVLVTEGKEEQVRHVSFCCLSFLKRARSSVDGISLKNDEFFSFIFRFRSTNAVNAINRASTRQF